MRTIRFLAGVALLSMAGLAGAQLVPALPRLGGVLDPVARLGERATEPVTRAAERLASTRLNRLAALIRDNPGRIERDPAGAPARAGELVLNDPDPAVLDAAAARGYSLIERGELIGIGYARLRVPEGRSLRAAIRELDRLGARDVSADQLHFASGTGTGAGGPPEPAGDGPRIGIIDGGVARGAAEQRGFAHGAPRVSDHASAIASLIAGAPGIRGVAPGARLHVADVYGDDPAGGNASAIAKAIAWCVEARVPVVTISLTGPANPLLARVVAAAQARGVVIVAAVGNDGPAAPPAYPASYPGVVAVTGVDGRDRVLIEAGRANHLDYAAPGADLLAADRAGKPGPVRGTSFAAPLVAALIARAYPEPAPDRRAAALAAIDRTARRLGAAYGRGLVCGDCRTRP